MTPLTRRATITYRKATPTQIEAGHRWYEEAHLIAASQAGTYGVTIEVAAGVLSALSPRMGWGPNVMVAERLLATEGTLMRGALGRSLAQARAIYAGADPDEILRGLKTNAFYHAIISGGRTGTPVIDRHAWDMLVGERGATPPTNRQYRLASATIERAADIVGVSAHQMQATTWIVHRRRFWNEGAFDLTARKPMLEGAASW